MEGRSKEDSHRVVEHPFVCSGVTVDEALGTATPEDSELAVTADKAKTEDKESSTLSAGTADIQKDSTLHFVLRLRGLRLA